MVLAFASSKPPVTRHSSILDAPSPSAAILRQSQTVTVLSASMKLVKSGPSETISAFPARPLASTVTMSFVEVSPSMLTMLKVDCTSVESAFCSMAGEMAASVVRKTSMVARFGWIMPEPLAMPPRRQVLPPAVNSTASSLSRVSVVMMPSAAAWLPVLLRLPTSCGMPAAIGERSSGWPMTPGEPTTTSPGWMPSASARSAAVFSATSTPSALQVLALPLLQMTAWATPFCRCAFVTASGAPLTRFVV